MSSNILIRAADIPPGNIITKDMLIAARPLIAERITIDPPRFPAALRARVAYQAGTLPPLIIRSTEAIAEVKHD